MDPQTHQLELIVTREFWDKIADQALKNGNKKPPLEKDNSVLELNGNHVHHPKVDLNLFVSLNLSHCNLSYIPLLFNDTCHLKKLNLSHNNLTEIPKALFNTLRFLEHLDVSYNKIECFDDLPKCVLSLRTLRLNNNCLRNIPKFVLKVCCLNLEEFYYSNNEITSLSTAKFLYGGPYRLRKIELKNCIVRSQDLKYLKGIRTLRECNLSNDGPTNRNCFEFSKRFENFFINAMWDDQLHVLKLNDLNMCDLPASVSQLVNLQELYLSKNNIMWLPEAIVLLTELRVLDISKNKLFSFPNDINKFKKLEILKADSNSISEVPDFSCLSIKHLDLYDNCLDNCCVINWDTVLEVDFEYNYFNTNDISYCYNEKKTALRQLLNAKRKNEPKVAQPDYKSDCDDIPYVSEDECCLNGSEGEFKPEDAEESWGSTAEGCDNGCTASDNEWTGSEKPAIKTKTVKRRISRPPSWMLEDVE